MAIGVLNVPLLSPQQGDPYHYSLGKALAANRSAMENQYLPQQMEAKLNEAKLAQALQQIQLQYAPQQAQAEIAYKQAQIPNMQARTQAMQQKLPFLKEQLEQKGRMQEAKLEDPLMYQTGTAGQVGAMLYLKKHPELAGMNKPVHEAQTQSEIQNPEQHMGQVHEEGQSLAPTQQSGNYIDQIRNSLSSNMERQKAFSGYYKKRTQAYNYMSLPIDQKSAILAQAAGMGYDPQEATKLFMKGETTEDLAKAKGFDMGGLPDPIYPTTKTALTQIQKRQQALAEINSLNPTLTKAIAPYSRRFSGYSIKQIVEALKGENEDSQAKYLAARALMPEMSGLRMRAMQGQVGIEGIREITAASMGHLRAFQSTVSPSVYRKTNKYVDEWLEKSVTAANKAGLRTLGRRQEAETSRAKGIGTPRYSDDELAFTAKKHGLTIDQVKQRLGV